MLLAYAVDQFFDDLNCLFRQPWGDIGEEDRYGVGNLMVFSLSIHQKVPGARKGCCGKRREQKAVF